MNKRIVLLSLTLTLLLTACSGTRSNATNNGFGAQGTASTGNLSAALQVAIGTLKLDKTANTITKNQAAELLPLWETLRDLESSDTAAEQEKEALIAQIQETMTQQQIQAITAMNLTRQDMFSAMQSAGFSFTGAQNGNTQTQNGSTARNNGNNSGRNFGGGGGFAGGSPPDGGFPGGGGFQGQRNQTNSTSTNQNTARQANANPNRIPTPLVQAVIEYLKKTAGA